MTSRAALFSIVAAVIYTLAYYSNWPQLRYYLNTGFHLTPQPATAGHVIFWYGWLGTAVAGGALVVLIMPRNLLARLPAELGWVVPIVMVIAAALYEKRWFF